MNTSKKATVQDVAKLAGVSKATVSMVLNNKVNASFSSETIRKVNEAAHSLNYKMKEKSESVLGIQSNMIAVISPTLSNPYYSTLIQAVENEISELGYSIFICDTYRNPQIEKRYLDLLSHSAICGIIYTCMPYHKEIVNTMASKIPVVIVGDKNEAIDIDTVELSSEESGVILAEHLLSLGHRRFAFVTTPLNESNVPRIRRLEGIRKALKLSGEETKLIVRESKTDECFNKCDVNYESKLGYEQTLELLDKEQFTALIGVNDMVAYGILDALAEKKLKVPYEYSVCGFDNIFPSSFSGISLTTIDHFITHKGRDAVSILLKKINSKSASENPTSIFKVEYKPILIARQSTGPCRKQLY